MGIATGLVRTGHFVYESGHHGDTWLDLDLLIASPALMRATGEELAGRLIPLGADLVCGPLEGGAFLAQWVAATLGVSFAYTRRGDSGYELADVDVAGRSAVVVDDAINVGSATTATVDRLREAGAVVLAVASAIVCGPAGLTVGAEAGVPQVSLEQIDLRLWAPQDCPACRDQAAYS